MQMVTRCRRILAIDSFRRSVEALGAATTRQFVHALLEELARNPGVGLDLYEANMHVLRTRPYGPFPALSLFYKYDEETLYPAHVEPYDPLRLVDPAEPDDA
jgi:hypothetical protein